jgi:hypothetical protein
MGRQTQRHIGTRLLLIGGLILALVPPAIADDPPKEEPEKTATKQEQASTQQAPPAGSLAAAASKIKLQKPADSEGLVISDHNVKSTGSKAALSQGSGSAQPVSAAAPAAGAQQTTGTPTRSQQLAQELAAQKAKVDNMEAQLAQYNKDLAAPSADPKYPKWADSPYNRSPGVVDPAVAQRDEYAKRLEQEKAKLNQLLKEAQGAGVKVEKQPEKQPTTE